MITVVSPQCEDRPKVKEADYNTLFPKITLVTPVLNAAVYLEQTIRSVIFQGYPNLEYIIVDGGSTDGTVDIIRQYEHHLSWWSSEPDEGMYDAINKGFARSSGEIMGWISGTDMLHLRSLFTIGSIFRAFPDVEWITGIPTGFDDAGITIGVGKLPRWSRGRFLAGANQSIQQESTFWRRSLWERAGGYVDASRRLASDFELWIRFFRYAHLYSVNTIIGGFRSHGDSLGYQYQDECYRIQNEVIVRELDLVWYSWILKSFRKLNCVACRIPKVRGVWWWVVIRQLYHVPGPDWAPMIAWAWDTQGWVMQYSSLEKLHSRLKHMQEYLCSCLGAKSD